MDMKTTNFHSVDCIFNHILSPKIKIKLKLKYNSLGNEIGSFMHSTLMSWI